MGKKFRVNIVKNNNRTLEDPTLEKIALKAEKMLIREFISEITVVRWKRIVGNS